MTDVKEKTGLSGLMEQLPVGRLKEEAQGFGHALTERGLGKMSEHVEGLTGKLNDVANGNVTGKALQNVAEGDSPVKAGVKGVASKVKDKVKDKLGGGSAGGSKKLKQTTILESIDVPVNREVAYAQWTQFEDFPDFTKKVESVSQEEQETVRWKAQIFWSHRSWDAKIIDQVPNERIVWKSEGQKGHVDGAITFHELSPDLTRIQMVLEYYPQGLFERTGNIWRAQGRRARLELKHFARHVATNTILHQDELEAWPGEIHDGQVTEEDALDNDESDEQSQDDSDQQAEDQSDEQPEDRADEESDEDSEEQPEGQADDESEDESEDEDDQEEDEPADKAGGSSKEDSEKPSKGQAKQKSTGAAKG